MYQGDLWDRIESFLGNVERPSRYIGHEHNALRSDVAGSYRVALLYPDTYELGQSNLALEIFYQLINSQDGYSAERVYLPWVDMISLMRTEQIPLFTLESTSPVSGFDLLGITLPHELAATNILEALDLAGIPLHSCERSSKHPLVLGGGSVAFNPEPFAPFFDAFVIGEGEEVILELLALLSKNKKQGLSRRETLIALAGIEGVYVPSLYESDETGVLRPKIRQAPAIVKKRIVKDFANYPIPTDMIVPYIEVAHDRLTIEILRGCTRGCRFCQAGMIYRPVRERPANAIVEAVSQGLSKTGFDEVSLMSLSTTDHSQIKQILRRVNHSTENTGTAVSIPSQRLDAFGVEMAQLVSTNRKTGLTFAPEAGTQRLRDSINKNISDEDLLNAIRYAFELGWTRCKLYFMIGLPGETDDDVCGIADLANRSFKAAKEALPEGCNVPVKMSVSIAVFIPKAHTPFQFCGQISPGEVIRRIDLIKASGLYRGIDLHWHDPYASQIEAVLSRAGREAADLIEQSWKNGALFDAWTERFRRQHWIDAATTLSLDLDEMAQKGFAIDAALPWDHIDSGLSRKYLISEYQNSLTGKTTKDCTIASCRSCGVCSALDAKTSLEAIRCD